MPRHKFDVTYEIVTQESAEHGDADERGDICEQEGLRDAIKELHRTRTSRVDSAQWPETNPSPITGTERVYSVSVLNGMEFETGAHEERTLHIPQSVSAASSRRIARLAGARI